MASPSPHAVHTLLTQPSPATAPPHPRPSTLDPTHALILRGLVSHFACPNFRLPATLAAYRASDRSSFDRPLSAWEKCSLLNREALVRCLRADKWDLEKTKARIEETIVWRRDFACDQLDISPDGAHLRLEAATGKMFVLGFDNQARPIVHMRPRNQNTFVSPRRLQFAFWLIDRAVDLMPAGVESILLIVDLSGPQESPSVKQQRDFVRILGAHYCERLGQALVINMPSVFSWLLKLVKPFIDPVTLAKAVFDKADPLKHAPSEQLDAWLGGTSGYSFDIETYWPALIEECSKRRSERLEKWTCAKKTVGSSELSDEGIGQDCSSAPSGEVMVQDLTMPRSASIDGQSASGSAGQATTATDAETSSSSTNTTNPSIYTQSQLSNVPLNHSVPVKLISS